MSKEKEQDVKDMREIIKTIIEIDRGDYGYIIDDEHIDKILFSLDMKINQKVILL